MFGERENVPPKKLSKGHINAQYRRLLRFFNWLVEREYMDASPPNLIKPPSVDEKTVPVVTEKHMRNLLMLVDPALARTRAHRFRLVRSRACYICSGTLPVAWARFPSYARRI